MNHKGFALGAGVLFVLGLASGAGATETTRQVHSAALQDDYVVSCNDGPIARDYAAETHSGIPLTDPYAMQRGVDKGLIALKQTGGGERRVASYVIPRRSIRAIVTVKLKGSVLPDRDDLVFTTADLQLVDTFNADAGVFTASDVYRLPYVAGGVDRQMLRGDQSDLPDLLDIGLAAYSLAKHHCVS